MRFNDYNGANSSAVGLEGAPVGAAALTLIVKTRPAVSNIGVRPWTCRDRPAPVKCATSIDRGIRAVN